jgi:hypothetical protein
VAAEFAFLDVGKPYFPLGADLRLASESAGRTPMTGGRPEIASMASPR